MFTDYTMLLPVQELRQMVMNGPDKHPGAVAVEDEFGRVISLATFNQQVIPLPACTEVEVKLYTSASFES